VADRRELDERAQHGDGDVLLELGPAPERDARGQGDQREAGGDLAEADVDRGGRRGGGERAHVTRSSATGPCSTSDPPSIRTTQSASRRAWSRSWVTSTQESSSSRRRP